VLTENNKDCLIVGIELLTNLIIEATAKQSQIWLLGNGGSASTIEHFETDMLFIRKGKSLQQVSPRVFSLTTTSAVMTAIGNDVGFDDIFAVVLDRKCQKGDLVIAFSASGNSKNLIAAVKKAKQVGARTFSVLGFDGGLLKNLCDDSLLVISPIGEYGPVEDIHLSVCHAVSEKLRVRLENGNM
jgi:D-sedoheptulose 7-phosphate isomerase